MNNYADNSDATGDQLHDLVSRLFPICRSQTGQGVRQSLQMLRELIPLDICEVPSGVNVFDWEVPQEWNISDAWIADEDGNRIVNFRDSNLHVVNGSDPVRTTLPWSELKQHLTTLPDQPDLIPYRTSFFGNNWGFCLSQRKFDQLERIGERQYEVCIDASRVDGSLTYGELLIPGASDAEILLSTHTCHPSLANDGLTGMAIAAFVGQWLASQERQYSYRLLFAPATIGAITWLSLNDDNVKKIRHGLVLSCLGDSGHLNYRRSRRDTAEIDRTVVEVLGESCDDFAVHRFEPFGYDQRQFCSPGFDLPMGCLMRTPNGEYPQYHTSADDLNLVRPDALQHSFTTITQIIERLEQNYTATYLNVNPKCEPRLGKHGLYHAFGSRPDAQEIQQAILWVLNLSDGHSSLADIAHRSAVPITVLTEASSLLEEHGYLRRSRTRGESGAASKTLLKPELARRINRKHPMSPTVVTTDKQHAGGTCTQTNGSPNATQSTHSCRFCSAPVNHSVCDLGMHPLCENFLTEDQTNAAETFYPLHAFVCEKCFLIQVKEYVHGTEIFGGEYAYFSSFSDSWLEHCSRYVDSVTDRLSLNAESQVIELASNDGYLLQYFVRKDIPCIGIEPADNVAAAAEEKGVPTRVLYFGTDVATQLRDEGLRPNLMIANNVLAHVPGLNNFVGGIKVLLADDGVLTVEFPHVMQTLQQNQFDQIYQEHYCYFSLLTLQQVFAAHDMTIFDLDELSTHGGSLRIYVRHSNDDTKPITSAVTDIHDLEVAKGLTDIGTYTAFAEQVKETKRKVLEFLIQAKRDGQQVVGYGAPGKGNTMLNYCGVRTDFIDYVVDRNPYKHGRFLPGSHIPIYSPEKIAETKPDYIFILPWNLREEISNQLKYTREWGAKLVVPIPELTIF